MFAVSMAAASVAGCARQSMSPERAALICADRANLADRPRGRVGIGAGSGGISTNVGLTVTSDFLLRRDPQDVYDACFIEKTGFPPMAAR
ncbi:hypothetical protein PARPLA_02150 [Rhodobacteraceae bacterium THAF1]|nr:hypothetical protein FIU81_04155 [Palleronia sp. THAF1]VDC25696.1 hypothetical protein PARPLA_02150 [Rhodobacteraceae bacterium THAF1]